MKTSLRVTDMHIGYAHEGYVEQAPSASGVVQIEHLQFRFSVSFEITVEWQRNPPEVLPPVFQILPNTVLSSSLTFFGTGVNHQEVALKIEALCWEQNAQEIERYQNRVGELMAELLKEVEEFSC